MLCFGKRLTIVRNVCFETRTMKSLHVFSQTTRHHHIHHVDTGPGQCLIFLNYCFKMNNNAYHRWLQYIVKNNPEIYERKKYEGHLSGRYHLSIPADYEWGGKKTIISHYNAATWAFLFVHFYIFHKNPAKLCSMSSCALYNLSNPLSHFILIIEWHADGQKT